MNGLSDKLVEACASSSPAVHFTESEENALRKKVQIKTQALMMLSQELDQCRMQRDRYKLMADELQEDLAKFRQESLDKKTLNGFRSPAMKIVHSNQENSSKIGNSLEEDTKLMDLLVESQEQNKCLRLQVDTMRQKLKEAQEDIKALRSKRVEIARSNDVTLTLHQREEMIEQMEKLNVKCRQLKVDLQNVLDEKHELVVERDAFKCKAHRLNYELSQALSASKPVDIDALVNENRYLQERLQQLLEEKELTQQSMQKYKSMLDSKRQKGSIKLGGKSSVGSVMTFKQVEHLLQQGPNIPPQKAADALSELHSICTALLEALNDKNLALAHQRKANKILAARMCELDKTHQSPTLKLLDGYSNVNVDVKCDTTSITSDLSEDRFEDKESDLQSDANSIDKNIQSKKFESSAEQSSTENSVKSKENESCCSVKNEIENINESCILEDDQCHSKSIKYGYSTLCTKKPFYQKINYEESLKANLPEHLRLIVQKHLDELEAKDKETS